MRGRQEVGAIAPLVGAISVFAIAACGSPRAAVVSIDLPAASGAVPAPPVRVVSPPRRDEEAPVASVIPWRADEDAAREEAKRLGRPLLVFAHADWAMASVVLERDRLSELEVVAAARSFVPLRLDLTSAGPSDDARAARYGVVAVPMLLVVDPVRGTTRDLPTHDAALLAEALTAAAD